jgi:hypothetical protein
MQKVSHVTSALFLLAVLTACSGTGGTTPTAPSTPPATSPPSPSTPVASGPGSGTITIRELSPSPGATLTVRACPSGAVTRPCADQWRSTIDVQVNREMTNAVLVVRFYDGATLCGISANTLDVLPADRPVTFDLASISLWVTNSQPCQLPTRTTRMEVELWSDWSSWTNTLMMGLPGTYTFVSQ